MAKASTRQVVVLISALLGAWSAYRAGAVRTGNLELNALTVVGGADEVENKDRLDCIRQDDLDLVIPDETTKVVRMVIGVGSTTGSDVYISAEQVWIKSITAKLTLTRTFGNSFALELAGDAVPGPNSGLAVADVWISGVQLFSKSSWVDWGASLATDRQKLAEGQEGSLRFKLSGKGSAVWNEELGLWRIQLADKVTQPFAFTFKNQMILQKALNDYGGLDTIIMNALWAAVENALPTTLVASFNYLQPTEFAANIVARITGGMPSPQLPLALNMATTGTFDLEPMRLLQVLAEDLDPSEIAERRLRQLLGKTNLEELIKNSRPMLEATLERYGIGAEILDQKLDAEGLRVKMIEAAIRRVDGFTNALKPFIAAYKNSQTDAFQGLASSAEVVAGWDRSKNNGLLTAAICAPEATKKQRTVVEMPRAFMTAVGLSDALPTPPAGSSALVRSTGFSLENGQVRLERVTMQDFRVGSGKGADRKIFKLGGAVRDVSLSVPPSWNPGFAVTALETSLALTPDGRLTVVSGGRGLELRQVENTAGAAPLIPRISRSGSATDLAGPVPKGLQRPTRAQVILDKAGLAPQASATVALTILGANRRLQIQTTATVTAAVDVRAILRSMLVKRATADFGYVFAAEALTRTVVDGEAGIPASAPMIAVVSCGYLRVLKKAGAQTAADPIQRANMDPTSGGQLEIDISKYVSPPTVEVAANDQQCLVVYSGGQPVRKVSKGMFSSSKQAQEKLCGSAKAVARISEAISMQVQRFRLDRAKAEAWNFGTHEATSPQYQLAAGKESATLGSVIDLL